MNLFGEQRAPHPPIVYGLESEHACPNEGYNAMPPPPAGYPVSSFAGANSNNLPQHVPIQTKSRGDGFWKGCAAALCCCCVLETCF